MTDDPGSRRSTQKSWLERLGHVLLGEPQDQEELLDLLKDAEQRNILDTDALQMMEGVLDVSSMQVRDIMIPRSHMVSVEVNADIDNIIPVIVDSAHSRFPVLNENRDEVVGILLAKDLLKPLYHGDSKQLNLKKLLRPATIVPESKRLDVLLNEFRVNHNHMAIVVDEYGGISGLVTIEDVLERIVGEIEDEHDIEEDANIVSNDNQAHTIKALTPIEEFNEYFNCTLSDEEFDTIGGLVIHSLGYLPQRGESVTIGNYRFKVLNSDNRRISLLEVSLVETSVQE